MSIQLYAIPPSRVLVIRATPFREANFFVNGRFLNHPVGGVARAAREVGRRLGVRVTTIEAPRRASGVAGHLWEQAILSGRVPEGGVLWSPANTGPLAVPNQVVTIHDLSVFEHPKGTPLMFRMWYRFLLPRLTGRARLVLTPSQFSRQRLLARFRLPPERVQVVPNGVGAPFTDVWKGRPRPDSLPERYLLAVGTRPERKNFGTVLAGWRAAREKIPNLELMVIGGEIAMAGANVRPIFVTGLSDALLADTYRHAAALVYLSRYEGFGLPLLEAMACGTPVLAARRGALPEVGGDACLYVDPEDRDATAAQLMRLLEDDELRTTLVVKGRARAAEFSWDRAAEETWAMLQQAAGE